MKKHTVPFQSTQRPSENVREEHAGTTAAVLPEPHNYCSYKALRCTAEEFTNSCMLHSRKKVPFPKANQTIVGQGAASVNLTTHKLISLYAYIEALCYWSHVSTIQH